MRSLRPAALVMLASLLALSAVLAATHSSPDVIIGSKLAAKWTATTYEAATAEAHKKMLASGKRATITGEVVDVSCWLQLGKRGEAHVACGTKCISNGQPVGVLDDAGNLTLLFPEQHHARRDGQVTIKDTFLPLLAKRVTVSGMATQVRGVHALFVEGTPVPAAAGESR